MRLVSYDDYRVGALTADDSVVDLTGLLPDLPDEFRPMRMLLLIERWGELRPSAEALAASGGGVPLASVRCFGRVVSLTVIWSVETYSKCNHSKYIHNQKNHIQSSAPPPHICTYGE